MSISAEGAQLLPSVEALKARISGQTPLLLAIDGMCCSGKSTYAAQLAEALGANLFHMDDFYLQPAQRTKERLAEPGGNVDYERVRTEILFPLHAGQTVSFRRYDCHADLLLPAQQIPYRPVNILEGSYAAHPALMPFYDVTAALCVSKAEQRRRVILREGEQRAERFFSLWLPLEQHYFEGTGCFSRVQYVIDTTGLSR